MLVGCGGAWGARSPWNLEYSPSVGALVLWLLLLVLCWPLALLALVLYPLVWLLLLPFRVVGIAVDGALALRRAVLLLPARVLGGPRAVRR